MLLRSIAVLLLGAALLLGGAAEAAGKLNVNTASAAELARVPGFDSQIAVRILARRAQRPFRNLDELLEIQGISKLTMISAAEHIEVGPPAPVAPPPPAKKLDLNEASFAELLLLPEMTPRSAKAIVDYREQNRGFRSVEELGKVPGIDKRALITLLDRVTVRRSPARPASGGGDTIVLGDENWTAKRTTPTPVPAATPRPLEVGEKIDLNTASRQELERLPDIGPVMAQRIVEYRRRKGRFDSLDELLEVRGIGPTRLTSLRPWVTLGGAPARTPETRPTATRSAVAVQRTPVPAPSDPEPDGPVPRPQAARPAITPDGRVNINVADVEHLLTLPRMTREVAVEIVEYRAKNGPFRDTHSIVDVPSIGEAAYARLRDKIAVE